MLVGTVLVIGWACDGCLIKPVKLRHSRFRKSAVHHVCSCAPTWVCLCVCVIVHLISCEVILRLQMCW